MHPPPTQRNKLHKKGIPQIPLAEIRGKDSWIVFYELHFLCLEVTGQSIEKARRSLVPLPPLDSPTVCFFRVLIVTENGNRNWGGRKRGGRRQRWNVTDGQRCCSSLRQNPEINHNTVSSVPASMIRILTLIICKDPDPNPALDPGSDPSINMQKK